jgi:hypothetical protein
VRGWTPVAAWAQPDAAHQQRDRAESEPTLAEPDFYPRAGDSEHAGEGWVGRHDGDPARLGAVDPVGATDGLAELLGRRRLLDAPQELDGHAWS